MRPTSPRGQRRSSLRRTLRMEELVHHPSTGLQQKDRAQFKTRGGEGFLQPETDTSSPVKVTKRRFERIAACVRQESNRDVFGKQTTRKEDGLPPGRLGSNASAPEQKENGMDTSVQKHGQESEGGEAKSRTTQGLRATRHAPHPRSLAKRETHREIVVLKSVHAIAAFQGRKGVRHKSAKGERLHATRMFAHPRQAAILVDLNASQCIMQSFLRRWCKG